MISLFVNKSNQTKPNDMLHIGEAIQELMKRQGKTSTWLAQALCCDRTNVYNIYRRSSLDTLLLRRVSKVLHHDFFADLSEDLQKEMWKNSTSRPLLPTSLFVYKMPKIAAKTYLGGKEWRDGGKEWRSGARRHLRGRIAHQANLSLPPAMKLCRN